VRGAFGEDESPAGAPALTWCVYLGGKQRIRGGVGVIGTGVDGPGRAWDLTTWLSLYARCTLPIACWTAVLAMEHLTKANVLGGAVSEFNHLRLWPLAWWEDLRRGGRRLGVLCASALMHEKTVTRMPLASCVVPTGGIGWRARRRSRPR